MAVTIRDVAKATGVSPSTVSRVISDNPRISAETKKKVREAMKELGYHPNFIARSLVKQSTNVIGVVFPSSGKTAFQNPFFTEVLRAISEGAQDQRYGIQLTTGRTEEEIVNDVINMVQGQRVDGILMLYSRFDDPVLAYLLSQAFPFVVIGMPAAHADRITSIDNDNVRAAKEGTVELLERGHDRIGFVGGTGNFMVTRLRLAGYEQALAEAGLAIREDYIIQDGFRSGDGNRAVATMMSSDPSPTAIMVEDDLLAMNVLQALHEQGWHVPKDVSILSFNNTMFSELSNPPLSSVDIHIFELGLEAIKQLITKIADGEKPVKRVIIPHDIVWRESCLQRPI